MKMLRLLSVILVLGMMLTGCKKNYTVSIDEGEGSGTAPEPQIVSEDTIFDEWIRNGNTILMSGLELEGFAPAKTYRSSSFLTEGDIKYEASNLSSVKSDNPWVEGAAGDGTGEYLDLKWDHDISALVVVNGFISSERSELYEKNNRAKTIKIIFPNGTNIMHTLADTPNPQIVNLGGTGVKEIYIEIVDVYPGSQWNDTCISMIQGLQDELHEIFFKETFKEMIAPYCGYYIHVNWDYVNRTSNLNSTNILQDVEIVKLSLEDNLIYETISLENDELIAGTKHVLDFAYQWSRDSVFFRRENRYYPEVYYDAEYFTHPRLSIDSGRSFIIYSDIDIFVKEAADVPVAIQSAFSADAQSKYAGKYVFDHYEIINIFNRENPINDEEIKQEAINVTLHENGYLYAEYITADETFNIKEQFYITDKQTYITGSVGDGTMMSFDSSYEYENENTIVYNYSYARWSDDPDQEGTDIHYKIVYKKEML